MDQVGTYGLIQPLVATVDAAGPTKQAQKLFLIDGRHRYHALLELDGDVKADVKEQALAALRDLADEQSISDITRLGEPRQRSRDLMKQYEPTKEQLPDGKEGSPLVPLKIYLGQDDVDRIGMAVFLNKGQKRLAGGEEIEKLARALDTALESISGDPHGSEKMAIDDIVQGQGADRTLLVLSYHATSIMNDPDSPWFDLIGRYQGEVGSSGDRRKPLTAKNFLSFVEKVVDDTPLETLARRERELEVARLNRLGNIFFKEFGWPDDIPSKDNRYTATSLLARSFLIETLGLVLNQQFKPDGKLLSGEEPSDDKWKKIQAAVGRLKSRLDAQAKIRAEFESNKQKLSVTPPGDERQELLLEIDSLRGKLWSLDTIIPSLRGRLEPIVRG